MNEVTWERVAIALAKYYVDDVGRKILLTDQTKQELEENGFLEKLKDYVR